MGEYLERCRFVVVPSIWLENFPFAITEAFARGKPVIGSDRRGIPELVHQGAFGFVYDAESPHELCARIDRLWVDTGLSSRVGTAAKQWCDRRFTDEDCYEGLHQVYGGVIARNKGEATARERQERGVTVQDAARGMRIGRLDCQELAPGLSACRNGRGTQSLNHT